MVSYTWSILTITLRTVNEILCVIDLVKHIPVINALDTCLVILRSFFLGGGALGVIPFLADRTNGRAYATVLRPSVVCRLSSSSVTLCIVAKRCVLEQKLLLIAFRKPYMRNRLVPK